MSLTLCVYCGSRDGDDPAHLAAVGPHPHEIRRQGQKLHGHHALAPLQAMPLVHGNAVNQPHHHDQAKQQHAFVEESGQATAQGGGGATGTLGTGLHTQAALFRDREERHRDK